MGSPLSHEHVHAQYLYLLLTNVSLMVLFPSRNNWDLGQIPDTENLQ